MDDSSKQETSDKILHVLDLPQLHQRPKASDLLPTLARLKTKPTPWRAHFHTEHSDLDGDETQISEEGIPNYLTSIISSSLQWIGDEETREEIWEAASARLAERSGRTAQPTLSRTFLILCPSSRNPIQISLREPSLTADNLGHKTWLASYLLACRLPSLKPLLPPFANGPAQPYGSSTSGFHTQADPVRVLELGSGTGLLGIAAASLFPAWQVRLTDLEAIVPNLYANVDANIALFSYNNLPQVDELDWSLTPAPPAQQQPEGYSIILASDPLYSPSHPQWLFNTIHSHLLPHETSRVAVELPLRKAYVPEVEEFRKRMGDGGFSLLKSGEETGTEDWGDDGRQGSREVECWWGVWGWSSL